MARHILIFWLFQFCVGHLVSTCLSDCLGKKSSARPPVCKKKTEVGESLECVHIVMAIGKLAFRGHVMLLPPPAPPGKGGDEDME
jgi:hypothetical protein